MKMVQAVVRPEKVTDVLNALADNGIYPATRNSVLGRGRQQGLKVGSVHYDEMPKSSVFVVVEDDMVSKTVDVMVTAARTGGKGAYGDGKIFIIPVEQTVTISTGKYEL